jgi:hypothetical protein
MLDHRLAALCHHTIGSDTQISDAATSNTMGYLLRRHCQTRRRCSQPRSWSGQWCNTLMLLYQLQYIYNSLYSIYTVVATVQP